MIVRLNHYGQRTVRARVPELHAQAMLDHRVARGSTMHDVELPPIAWRQILDIMRDQCFGPMGGRLDRGVPKSAYSAIKRIAEAVMRVENHPALTGKAVDNWIGDVLLLWEPGVGELTVYPHPGATPVLYGPIHLTVADRQVTVWRPVNRPDYDAWSLRPENHLAFVAAQSTPSI